MADADVRAGPPVVLPTHWSTLFSWVAISALVALTVTGIVLALLYRPSIEPVVYDGGLELYADRELPAAFASVVRISHDLPGGLLLRRVHRVASHLFLLAVVGHGLQVLLTGAFRRPRRGNHVLGVALGVVALAWGYSGLNLPFELVAGTSLRVGYSLLLSVPYVGEPLALLAYGGDFPTGDIIRRLWALHVVVLPVAFLVGLAVHAMVVARTTHAQAPVPTVDVHAVVVGDAPRAAWARFGYVLLVSTGLLVVSSALVPWSDVLLQGPYVAGQASNTLQPDWYLFWSEGAMRILPAIDVEVLGTTLTNPFVAAVALPALVVAFVALYPWVDPLVTGDRGERHLLAHPLDAPSRFGVVTALSLLVLVLSVGAADDVIAETLRVSVYAVVRVLRVLLAVVPPLGGWTAYRYARSQAPRWEVDA